MTDSSLSSTTKSSRRKSTIGTVIALLVLAGLAGLTWYLTHRDNSTGGPGGRPGGRGTPPTTVGVATAERMDLPVYLEALGTVTSTATSIVRAQVSGLLQSVQFTEGQMVKKGQVLATIDPRPFELALLQASGQRKRDEAQLENARITLERDRVLLKQDSIAQQDVDTQAALVKQLEGTLDADRAAEGNAKLNLSYTKITAPVDGRAGLRMADVGNLVSTSDANGVVVITQMSPIDVAFAVPQDRLPELQASLRQTQELAVTALDRTRTNTLDTGKFLALDNQIDVQTGTVRAKARYANTNSVLYPQQFVNIRLLMRTIKDAIVIPVTGLRHGSNNDFVFVLNRADKTVSQRTVTRGQATVDKVEIVSGLKAGEQVITEGADRLKDGSRVLLPGDRPAYGGKGKGKEANSSWSGAGQASAPASASAPAASAPLPTPEQRQRMLDQVKDDPQALARRKAFLEKLDKGDPEALERWRQIQERQGQAQQSGAAAPSEQHPKGEQPAGSRGEHPSPGHASASAASAPLPTPEQRQRMLDEVKDDPQALARRKAYFEKLDKGDPEALERWPKILEQRRQAQQSGAPLPTPEQRQRMLDEVKDDPQALARRKAFFEKLDKGDPQALERWRQIVAQIRQGGQPSSK